MKYPDVSKLRQLFDQLFLYGQLKLDYGSPGVAPLLTRLEKDLQSRLDELRALPEDAALARREPNDLAGIRSLRPAGPRRLWDHFDAPIYREKLEGALLGRMAGCVLGAAVEGWPIARMQALARENGDPFPPTDYWKSLPEPAAQHYGISPQAAYSRTRMDGVPVDDDITYTLLGLFIAEEYGPGFTTEDVARAWLKYLPVACTAEEITLKNLKAGLPALEAGAQDNPFTEWIGADIRSDSWGYLAPGQPELAAQMAYRDAYLSHRRQGIYGEMFFSAAIAAAFQVSEPLEALRIGLTEIPADCLLAGHLRWALEEAPHIKDHLQARRAVDERFPGMSGAHTLNNACLTVFGLSIGGTDLTRVIGETVAMGLDNDCTAATAGSLVGAVVGKSGLPGHWFRNFKDCIHTYMIDTPRLAITDVVDRFEKQAVRVFQEHSRM